MAGASTAYAHRTSIDATEGVAHPPHTNTDWAFPIVRPPPVSFIQRGLAERTGAILHTEIADFTLLSGQQVPSIRLGYCLYGTNAENPLVVVHPALTGSPRVCKGPSEGVVTSSSDLQGDGWWDDVIGPERMIDTNMYTVMCVAHVGGRGGSSTAHELSRYNLSIADTVNLTGRVLREQGVRKVAAVVGGSMGAFQALSWLHQDDVEVGKIIDICGSAPGCEHSMEFFALQRDLLFGEAPDSIADRLAANCNQLAAKSPAFNCALQHVLKQLLDLNDPRAEITGEDPRLSTARQIGFLRFVAPGFYEEKLSKYVAATGDRALAEGRLRDWLTRQGTDFCRRFDGVALGTLCGMLADVSPIDPKRVASLLNERRVQWKGVSVQGDTLWPAEPRNSFFAQVKAELPGVSKLNASNLEVVDEVNGHDYFLGKAFVESPEIRRFIGLSDDIS